MTFKEYIATIAARFGVGTADIDMILINRRDLIPDPEAEVIPETAKRALVAEFASVIPLANVSEGGYSVSWNWDAIKFWYNQTCAELGITPEGKPKIRNRSNRW